MQYNWTKILNSQVVQNWKASKEIKSTPPQSSHNLLQYQKIIPKIKTSLASWRKEIPERRARQWGWLTHCSIPGGLYNRHRA